MTKPEPPLVSVIMPAYNAAKTINESIDSILNQSYKNIELLVIDDGSNDETASIINSYADSRVKYVKNENNMGLVKTLNKAISISTGKYVARMDSDDIALKLRIEREVDYMESHPECIICGTFAKYFSEVEGEKTFGRIMKYEVEDAKIKKELAYECCFAHPTVMFRSSVFSETDKRYDDDYLNSEDYNYWIDLMDLGNYHNIPKVLLYYRISPTQMSAASDVTNRNSSRARLNYIEKQYGVELLEEIKKNKPCVAIIKLLKDENIDNLYLYKLLYLSFTNYSLKDLLYYSLSGDIFRHTFKTTLQLCKRVLRGPAPLLLL